MNGSSMPDQPLIISYLTLRKIVGYLGMALPFVLALGYLLFWGQGIQSSVSYYYHTGMRNVFVGALCAIGVFMVSYKGYERKDDVAGKIACLFALGVAFFPTVPDVDPSSRERCIGYVHLACASAYFLTLVYFSLFLFTKSAPNGTPTRKKLQRNAVYRVCGYVMLAALVLMLVFALLPKDMLGEVRKLKPTFWLESVAVVAFGISWFVKGEGILKDEA